ncbi:hypothetical protein PanWU01x14_081750, partial [Parasponia andersonii]
MSFPLFFSRSTVFPTDGTKLLEGFLTSCPHVSELLMLYSPTVHVSSLSKKCPELQAGTERQGWPPAKTLRCLSQ